MSYIHRFGVACVVSLLLCAPCVWAANAPARVNHGPAASLVTTDPPFTEAEWNEAYKEQIEAEHAASQAPASGDKNVTPKFTGAQMHAFWSPPSAGTTSTEDGLSVFPYTSCSTTFLCFHAGWYVVGRQQNSDNSWRAVITRWKTDGTRDTTFGTDGWMYTSVSGNIEIVDAARAGNKMYILTTMDFGGIPIMRVICKDMTTDTNCFPLFGGLATFSASTSGPVHSAWARRILYDSRYGLFVVGKIFTDAHGWEMAVARLDANTGAHINSFGSNGEIHGLPTWGPQSGSVLDVFDIAVVPNGTPGGARLYIAGDIKLTATDYDGLIWGVDPNTGITSPNWAWITRYYETDNNTGYKKDAITAITVLRTGAVAMAGWSENDDGERLMILTRALANGAHDPSFCGSVSGICVAPIRPLIGVADDYFPVAIAERRANRDLVVALKAKKRSADYHFVQNVYQFSADGTYIHDSQEMDYGAAAGGHPQWSRPFGMSLSNSGLLGLSGKEVIAVAGTRLWWAPDYDMTLSSFYVDDSIFADGFGG